MYLIEVEGALELSHCILSASSLEATPLTKQVSQENGRRSCHKTEELRVWKVMHPRLLWLLSPWKWKPSTLGLCYEAVDMQGYEGIDAECIWALVCLFISLWWSLISETSGAIPGGDTKELVRQTETIWSRPCDSVLEVKVCTCLFLPCYRKAEVFHIQVWQIDLQSQHVGADSGRTNVKVIIGVTPGTRHLKPQETPSKKG